MFATLRRLQSETRPGRLVANLTPHSTKRPSSEYPSIRSLQGSIPEGTPSPTGHFFRNVWFLLNKPTKRPRARPDGFVRVRDVTGRFPFRETTEQDFIRSARRAHGLIEIVHEPDTYASTSQDLLWWFRSKERRVPKGVETTNFRLLPGTSKKTAIFKATLPEWEYIRVNGLRPRPGHELITMERIDQIEETMDVVNTSHVYVFIDITKAMEGGIDFYFTRYLKVVSPGNRDSVISPKYFKDAIEVTVEKEVLHPMSPEQLGPEEHGEPMTKEPYSDRDLQLTPLPKPRRKKPLTPWQEAVAS